MISLVKDRYCYRLTREELEFEVTTDIVFSDATENACFIEDINNLLA